MKVIRFYKNRDIPHRCKILFVTDFLSDEQMVSLAERSTYYLQTTKAEGNCLPLMNFLAAGRPAISPCHTAIADYFDETMGFPVESHAEPAAWPQDSRFRSRTTWQRLVWTSLVDQLKRSYQIAKNEQSVYEVMSQNCRAKMLSWSHETVVTDRLLNSLSAVSASKSSNHVNLDSMTHSLADKQSEKKLITDETAESKSTRKAA